MRKASLVQLSITVLMAITYFACGETPNQVELGLDKSALDETQTPFEPSPQDVLAAQERNTKGKALINSLREHMVDEEVEDITIKWNYTDNAKLFWGDGLEISLSSLGCSAKTVLSSIECFFGKYKDTFGIDPENEDLRLIKSTELKNGETIYRFRQLVSGYEVRGADVLITVNASGNLTRVYSRYVAGLEVEIGSNSDLYAVFGNADKKQLEETVRSELSNEVSDFYSENNFIYVDMKNESVNGVPAVLYSVVMQNGKYKDVFVDVISGTVIKIMDRTVEYAAAQLNKTQVAYPEFTSNNCGYMDLCFYPYTCTTDTDPKKCVDKCYSDSDCSSAYDGNWKCWTGDSTFPNYCYLHTFPGTPLTIYDDGWESAAYSYHKRFSDLVDKMDDVMAFHYDDLGRDSWNDSDGDYEVMLNSYCGPGTSYMSGCPPASTSGTGDINFYGWFYLADNSDLRTSQAYHVMSHEWGHNIVRSIADGWVNSDCINENVADIYGSLLSVDKVGGSDTQFDYDCGGEQYRSPWDDEPNGLDAGCTRLPYNQRSRFDWFDCGSLTWGDECDDDSDCDPYELCRHYSGDTYKCTNAAECHNNAYIWNRFIRVLSEGPDTFDNDDNDEDVGVSFTGVGFDTTVNIIYAATLNLSTSTDLEDWVDLVISAGSSYGKVWEVRKALGIVGFIGYTGNPTTGESNKAPTRYYFSGWTGESKYFYVWKDRTSYDIKVLRYRSGWYTDTISANTSYAPAVVEHNSRLYIFWRDRTSNAINFKYYRYDGNTWGPFDMSSKSITANGSFDAVEFDSKLYLVFGGYGGHTVYVAKCTTDVCNDSGWYDYGSSTYKRSLGFTAYDGMGADVATSLNGTGFNTSLYIVSGAYSYGNYRRIRVDQVDTSDTVTHTSWMPTTYPSYRAYSEIGVKAVSSAFPSATTHLWIAWRDYSSTKIYTSVVQKYDDDDDSDTWFTRSVDTFLDSYYGVKFMKGDGAAVDLVQLSHSDMGYDIHYSYHYGRY